MAHPWLCLWLYGRDAGLPEEAISTKRTPYMVDVTDYMMELITSLSEAWELARTSIDKAQQAQKKEIRVLVSSPFNQEIE